MIRVLGLKDSTMDNLKSEKQINPGQDQSHKLGTFAGVFTPSILTILGVILFLRLGYVVGDAGLGRSLLIIGLANTISVLTTFSLSAIATNLNVKGGGDYYLISRTLGLEFGGSIGIVLFLAQSVSIAFYCMGFGEVLQSIMPDSLPINSRVIATSSVFLLFIFAWLGADWATRFQYLVMILLGASLISFFIGGIPRIDTGLLNQNWGAAAGSKGFWIIFAIFFPAVTGFTQGVSMSGDLKDPGKSLPLGTFLAVGISIAVYFSAAFVFASVLPNESLSNDFGSMKKIARYGFLIDAGVIAAILSSAMASFLGAPRILQSLASDRIFPFLIPFEKVSGKHSNPRRGILLSGAIAIMVVSLGRLDLIAPVVSMFFLISYGLLNYATYYEAKSGSTSFRPRFKWFDYRVSLFGWLACLGVILAIDIKAGIIAISILFAIYQYLKNTAGPSRWADSRRSFNMGQIRKHLIDIADKPEHPRDWRPSIIALSDHPERRGQLLRFASFLEGRSGFTSAVKILKGRGIRMRKACREAEKEIMDSIRVNNSTAFPLAVSSPTLKSGLNMLLQSYGIGQLKGNTVLLNWFDNRSVSESEEARFNKNLSMMFHLNYNIILLCMHKGEQFQMGRTEDSEKIIDVWWSSSKSDQLMLLLAYLVTRNSEWEDASIRLLIPADNEDTSLTLEEINSELDRFRIQAQPIVVESPDVKGFINHSWDSSLVFIPFRIIGHHVRDLFGGEIDSLLTHLPAVALVKAAQNIDLDADPEEGTAGKMAEAMDAFNRAEKRAKDAEKETLKAIAELEELEARIKNLTADPERDDSILEKLRANFNDAVTIAENATRRSAREFSKLKNAAIEAESLGLVMSSVDLEENTP